MYYYYCFVHAATCGLVFLQDGLLFLMAKFFGTYNVLNDFYKKNCGGWKKIAILLWKKCVKSVSYIIFTDESIKNKNR